MIAQIIQQPHDTPKIVRFRKQHRFGATTSQGEPSTRNSLMLVPICVCSSRGTPGGIRTNDPGIRKRGSAVVGH